MRILIVENDPLIALPIEDILLGAGHAVVGIARDVDSALAMAKTLTFDLALVDYSLADNSCGADAIGLLRDRYERPSIFVSGSADDCRRAWKEAGAPDCLTKPFDDFELIRAVAITEALIEKLRPKRLLESFEIYGSDN